MRSDSVMVCYVLAVGSLWRARRQNARSKIGRDDVMTVDDEIKSARLLCPASSV